MNISVLGSGRWGTFLAWYLSNLGHNVLLYGREGSDKFESLLKERGNEYLTLQDNVILSSSLAEAASFSDIIIISIASQGLRSLMQNLQKLPFNNKTIVLCMKGLEQETGKRLTQIVNEYINESCKVAIWVGPGHVQAYVKNIPNCMVIDSEDDNTKKALVDLFSSSLIRFYYGNDLIGNEVGAAAKNVIGIAAGMLDGLGFSTLKGALMARGTREIGRLNRAMGGKEITAYGLAHLGDYEATLFSPYSHNRGFGEAFVKGIPYPQLAEGVYTVKALLRLGEIYNVELPISSAVNRIIHQKEKPDTVLNDLFLRSIKTEF